MPDSVLQEIFPKADALYRLFQNLFDGYGYDSNGKMINGIEAIPAQTRIPLPTEAPIDPDWNDNGDYTGRTNQPNRNIDTVALDNKPITPKDRIGVAVLNNPGGKQEVIGVTNGSKIIAKTFDRFTKKA
jgi:hypothetical protein